MSERWTVHDGDVLAVLRTMPDASFDAMLADPPAGIALMNRDWDRDKGGRTAWIAWLAEIMREALRCLKPGARALVWSLPRTQHWTMTALEDAGFEITDTIDHIFASGFPKSASVSLLLDRAAGAEREVVGRKTDPRYLLPRKRGFDAEHSGLHSSGPDDPAALITAPTTPLAKRWDGYGTALKPAKEVWILCRKPLDGTIVANVTKHGVGGLAIDACRIAGPASVGGSSGDGMGFHGDDCERTIDRSMAAGRWPANLVLSHDPRCKRVGTKRVRGAAPMGPNSGNKGGGVASTSHYVNEDGRETVDAYECVDGCPVKLLDEQSGDRPGMSGGGNHRADYGGGMFGAIDCSHTARGDSGGASRFFFCAKPSSSERNFGCEHLPLRSAGEATGGREEGSDGLNSPRSGAGRTGGARNFHPTIKAIKLTKYFATLLLPPARETPRRILTPFAGSGSEMIGAMRAGWEECVGIEQDADFVTIASARLARWEQVAPHLDEAEAVASASEPDERQPSLFDGVGT